MKNSQSEDKIVYTLVTEPGGVDGLDRDDKGGVVVLASYEKGIVERRKGQDTRYKIVPQIVNIATAKMEAIRKLNVIDRLILDIPQR